MIRPRAFIAVNLLFHKDNLFYMMKSPFSKIISGFPSTTIDQLKMTGSSQSLMSIYAQVLDGLTIGLTKSNSC